MWRQYTCLLYTSILIEGIDPGTTLVVKETRAKTGYEPVSYTHLNDPKQRLSVRKKVEAIKAQEAQRDKGQPQREKGAPVFHRSRGGKKQKGGLER